MKSTDCRIVLLTANRSGFLAMPLASLAFQNCRLPITIADGSSEEDHARRNAELVETYRDRLDITYQRYPSEMDFGRRLIAALEASAEPLVAPAADDDFYAVAALEKAARVLSKKPDAAVCHGYAFLLQSRENRHFGALTYKRCALPQDDPELRLRNHFNQYSTTYYAVRRRENLIHQVRAAQPLCSALPMMWEMALSAMSVVEGKVICLPELFQIRYAHSGQAGKANRLAHYLFDEDAVAHYRQGAEIIAAHLQGATGMDQDAAVRLVQDGIVAWLATNDHLAFTKSLDFRQDAYIRALFEEGSFEREENLPFLKNVVECIQAFQAGTTGGRHE